MNVQPGARQVGRSAGSARKRKVGAEILSQRFHSGASPSRRCRGSGHEIDDGCKQNRGYDCLPNELGIARCELDNELGVSFGAQFAPRNS